MARRFIQTSSKKPSQNDVARLARVSRTTVSYVLNGTASTIPQETQARVLAAAKGLRYRPHGLARGLRRSRTDTFGFISDEIATSPVAGAMIQGAQDAAWKGGIVLLMVNTGRDRAIEARALDIMLERRVDALIFATMRHTVIDPPEQLWEVPTVLLDARDSDESLPSVVPDEVGAAWTAVQTLLKHGHKRIGFINTMEPVPAATERLEGYRLALVNQGIAFDPALVAHCPNALPADGEEATPQLLDLPQPPTAIFCFNDRIAMGAYRAINRRGLRIPDDISVIGFDNQDQIAAWLEPGLTTMQLPHSAMGAWAVEYLMSSIAVPSEADRQPPQRRLPCPLVERMSVGPGGRP